MLAISNSRAGAESNKLAVGEPLPISVGDVVAGKYTVDAIIGVGGMGVVASATHVALGQRVALKVMRTARMNHETADRFLREARAAVSLKSSHVAKVLDVGTLASGLPFMVMELLEGRDLSSHLELQGALPVAEAVDYVLQACDALSEAHGLGIVHRDLKPENLFVTERRDGTPLVKVLDFGISKITTTIEISEPSAPRRAITHESTLMGSPMYMSPEQVRSAKNVDGRSDIWALGAILFELIAGRSAFYAESVPDIFVKILDKPAPLLEEALRDPPAGLSATIARCLEKDREKRFQTVDELAAALSTLGIKPTTPTIPPWDRGEIEVAPSSDRALVGAPPSAPLVLGPPQSRVAAETFVLPGRARSNRSALVGVFAVLAIAGLALAAGAFYRHKLSATVASKRGPAQPMSAVSSGTVSAPLGDVVPDTSSLLEGTSVGSARVTEPAASAGRGSAAGGRPRAGARAGSGSKASSSTSGVAAAGSDNASTIEAPPVAPEPTTPAAPVPTLRRTDW